MISDAGENSQKVRCFIGIAASDVGLEDGLVQQMALYRQRPGWDATLDARAFSASDPGFSW